MSVRSQDGQEGVLSLSSSIVQSSIVENVTQHCHVIIRSGSSAVFNDKFGKNPPTPAPVSYHGRLSRIFRLLVFPGYIVLRDVI